MDDTKDTIVALCALCGKMVNAPAGPYKDPMIDVFQVICKECDIRKVPHYYNRMLSLQYTYLMGLRPYTVDVGGKILRIPPIEDFGFTQEDIGGVKMVLLRHHKEGKHGTVSGLRS